MKGEIFMKRKKTLLVATLVVAGLIIGGGTFAWFTSEDSVVNTLKTGTFKTIVTESFTPPTNWEPGQKVEKKVGVTNVGSTDAIVKVQLVQDVFKDEDSETKTDNIKYVTETELKKYTNNDAWEHEDIKINSDTYTVYQKKIVDSKNTTDTATVYKYELFATKSVDGGNQYVKIDIPTNYDGTIASLSSATFTPMYLKRTQVVESTTFDNTNASSNNKYLNYVQLNFSNEVAFTSGEITNDTKWIFNPTDNYFYYIGVVKPGESTETDLLESVELLKGADNDYQGLEYNLTVNQEGTQAFKAGEGDYEGAIAEFVGKGGNETTIEGKLAELADIHTEGETYTETTTAATE